MTMNLPKFELREEGSQVRRSSKSVTAMIVEGYARRKYKAEFIKYLVYAQSEWDETMIHLDFIYEADSLQDQAIYRELQNEYDI